MRPKGKTLKVKCPDCKKEFEIYEKDICKNIRGEQFISCKQPYDYPLSCKSRYCNGYISIPENVIPTKDNDGNGGSID